MRTPYDAAIRALERDMDALKALIIDASSQLDSISQLHRQFTDRIAQEHRISAADWQVYACAYLDHARAQRNQLAQLRADAEAELNTLRDQAAQQYASIKAITAAADTYRAEAARMALAAEQAAMDDMSAERFVRRIREFRRSRRS